MVVRAGWHTEWRVLLGSVCVCTMRRCALGVSSPTHAAAVANIIIHEINSQENVEKNKKSTRFGRVEICLSLSSFYLASLLLMCYALPQCCCECFVGLLFALFVCVLLDFCFILAWWFGWREYGCDFTLLHPPQGGEGGEGGEDRGRVWADSRYYKVWRLLIPTKQVFLNNNKII